MAKRDAAAERVADLETKVDFFFNHMQSVPNAAALLTEAVNKLQAVEMNYPRYVKITKQLESDLGGEMNEGERFEIYQMTLDRMRNTLAPNPVKAIETTDGETNKQPLQHSYSPGLRWRVLAANSRRDFAAKSCLVT